MTSPGKTGQARPPASGLSGILRAGLRFAAVGFASVGVYFLFLFLLRPLIPSVAGLAAAAYLGSMVFNFLGQSRFTFRTRSVNRTMLLRYVVMHGVCAGLNSAGMHVLVAVSGFDLWVSQLCVTALVTATSFAMSYLWVYVHRDI